ncbi:virulence protein [Duffyella gerundensis]|uniref:Virulence protein n=1 Tax=Duffyella gerundensis TaxID=1619313 RepID=A0A0U5L783_9GAMM|nr:VOC family protein [Duffyella gerundensis]CUU24343.1 virulence protein [Duffyella gerundensis]
MIDHLDHLVLTTHNAEACTAFYTRVLGMQLITFGENRQALVYGAQKINVHQYGHEFEPKAHLPVPGSLDLCFICNISLDEVITHLHATQTHIIEGPVTRTGARGPITSVYVRDPDLNLIELARYEE